MGRVCWALRKVAQFQKKVGADLSSYSGYPLFRGLGNSDWGLDSTLERCFDVESGQEITDFRLHYQSVYSALASIETFTEREWPDLPNPIEFIESIRQFETLDARFFFARNTPIYRFLIYLRHHGYPSPLLDWSASPYVAAFFAFHGFPGGAKFVSVHALVQDKVRSLSGGEPTITVLGPNIRSHRRHMIQQSSYTLCMIWEESYQLSKHEQSVSAGALGVKGKWIRIDIPVSERAKALKTLDLMNINAYSLFNT